MTKSEICERLGSATTWEMVRSEYGGRDVEDILISLDEMFPNDDNYELAAEIYRLTD